jgi:hypothetical protein
MTGCGTAGAAGATAHTADQAAARLFAISDRLMASTIGHFLWKGVYETASIVDGFFDLDPGKCNRSICGGEVRPYRIRHGSTCLLRSNISPRRNVGPAKA